MTVGLVASLIPQTSYSAFSNNQPEGDALVAWPGWSVQQDLGFLNGTVGAFRVWVSTHPNAFRDATVNVSLVDASTREVIRQASIRVSRSYIPAQHTVRFSSYEVPRTQRLMLQLSVGECQNCHVIFRLANPEIGRPNAMLNGVADAGSGSLAFAHVNTGSGLRAAIVGDASSRIRLVLAAVSGILAGFAHRRVLISLRGFITTARRTVARRLIAALPPTASLANPSSTEPPSGYRCLLTTPWYPWLAATVPILHFVASNPLHFTPAMAVVPLAVTLALVTCLVVGLRLALNDWNRPAAISTVVIAVVFGYGHVARAFDGRVDDRAMFGISAALAAAAVTLIARHGAEARRWSLHLNFSTAVLLVFPCVSLIAGAVTARANERPQAAVGLQELAEHLPRSRGQGVPGPRPDIYYIILDSYARNDSLIDQFDYENSEFVRELESRGFYVASKATSNYTYTIHSTPSILNLHYLDKLGTRIPATHGDLLDIARFHAIGAILQDLGYTFVHLDSGVISTEQSPQADQVVSFTPSGPIVRASASAGSRPGLNVSDTILSSRFIRRLVQTTALRPLLGQQFLLSSADPYPWWSPVRTLQMFDFLSKPMQANSPKFVLAHIVKPHDPSTFDKEGNYIDDDQGFDDYHDPSVPNAYIGQLIYVNKLVLDMVDAILRHHADPPIIVITGDHGHGASRGHRHSILSAFHLPYGGTEGLHPNISSVNHFRYILDFYFDYGLGLLDDQLFWLPSDHFDFRNSL